ncbi:MAG: HAD family hydrolase [Treponema sp.]|jgi:putative hydrolase of the HAD superfamily|nr:HAD family hydrolase [Treponema sp.]
MSKKFDGIAFDVDGTLYSNHHFYFRIIPFLFQQPRFLMAWGKARNAIRKDTAKDYKPKIFYEIQASLMAGYLKSDVELVQKKLDTLIYRGWEEIFGVIPLFPYVKEVLQEFRRAGFKLGLLSDVPPDRKLRLLGLDGLWDVQLCSELAGGLKPARAPFLALAEQMGFPPERILYVGNSIHYDVIGSKSVGMKAALIAPGIFHFFRTKGRPGGKREGDADFVFSSYRQLSAYVLN